MKSMAAITVSLNFFDFMVFLIWNIGGLCKNKDKHSGPLEKSIGANTPDHPIPQNKTNKKGYLKGIKKLFDQSVKGVSDKFKKT
jgi:hypothetical protein